MSPTDFRALPLLLCRRHLILCGLKKGTIYNARFELRRRDEEVPEGFIGWIPDRPGGKKGKFRKWDVARFIGMRE